MRVQLIDLILYNRAHFLELGDNPLTEGWACDWVSAIMSSDHAERYGILDWGYTRREDGTLSLPKILGHTTHVHLHVVIKPFHQLRRLMNENLVAYNATHLRYFDTDDYREGNYTYWLSDVVYV